MLAAKMLAIVPPRPERNVPAIATPSNAGAKGGNCISGRLGHGRLSRPETFTMRPASHRLKTLVMVDRIAPASGMIVTMKLISFDVSTPGMLSGWSIGPREGERI